MKNIIIKSLLSLGVMTLAVTSCNTNTEVNSGETTLTDVIQTSGQLASGSSFTLSGSSTSTGANGPGSPMGPGGGPHHGKGGPGGREGFLLGTSLLAPSDDLLAVIDAESAGDFRGLRMHEMGGATVTNYDASGNVVTMSTPAQNSGGPEGCSFSGKQFPKFDSLLSKIAKTSVDFGTGVTSTHGTSSITRSGKITITRSGDSTTKTETVTFENYKVNGASIEGIKTRVSTLDSSGRLGSSATNVANGKITFSDGTGTTWTSTKTRKSSITFDSNNKPVSGQIVTDGSTNIKTTDGTVIFSNTITKSLVEDVACSHHHGPVSGTVATVFKTDTVSIDFGDGSCSNNTVTVTLNGVVTSKTIGQ